VFAIARYLPAGMLDPTFGRDGKLMTWVNNYDQKANAVALRPGGRFIVAGSATGIRGFVLVGYQLDGTLDRSFGAGGIVATDTGFGAPTVGGLATNPDGNVIVTGGALNDLGHPVLAMARYQVGPVLDQDEPPTSSPVAPAPVGGTTAQNGASRPSRSGYWMVTTGGAVYGFGAAPPLGNAVPGSVDLEPTRAGAGYWTLNQDGRVQAFGDAPTLGHLDPTRLSKGEAPASLSATPSGNGYWIFTNRGRVIPFGDAPFLGDVSALKLNRPVLGSVATPSGKGYYMVASDGGIFTFGDAAFLGSMGATKLNAPVQSLVPDPDGHGYWLVASDGGIFAFDAPFHGSMGAK
jgi:hypothetical protein